MMLRCRFAPSPSGQLHVGGARTALFNFLLARRAGGRFVLRIEDTDRARSSLESEQAIKEDLAWLGIHCDEGPDEGGPGAPYRQSERTALYDEHLALLLARGLAYEAWESTEELTALREASSEFKYRRRELSPEQIAAFKAEGRVPVLRLAARGRSVSFVDETVGEVTVDGVEDFVIKKADGFPTYHLAVVVDDHHMQVTHVLRAKEHLMNTAKHLLLYEAFGWQPPSHSHAPLIFSMAGGKMSKRDKAKAAREAVRASGLDDAALSAATGADEASIEAFRRKKSDDLGLAVALASALKVELPEIDVIDFRRSGYLPEALVNFLALLGWSAGDDRELYSLEELVQAFSTERIGSAAARFDREKLRWMNGMHIRSASLDRLVEATADFVAHNPDSRLAGQSPERLRRLLAAYQQRINTLAELEEQGHFFFERPTEWGPEKAIKKHLLKGDGLARLAAAQLLLREATDWSAEGIEAALHAAAEASYAGAMGKLAQPVRVAVAGGPVSPAIGETLALLGREESLARVQACLDRYAD